MTRSLLSIESYIKSKPFRQRLRDDLEAFRIIKEADFQACFYFHLRKFIGQDDRWRIYREKNTPFGNIIDLVISQQAHNPNEGFKPRIAIELKRSRNDISSKDRRSLGKSLEKLKVNKAYFFTVNYHAEKYNKAKKKAKEKYKLHEWDIRLGKKIRENPAKLEAWLQKRRRIKENRDISTRKIN